jgi:hypothetical protein
MRKSLLALGVVAAVAAVPASAEYLYGFGGVYLDYQKWDHEFTSNNGDANSSRNKAVLGIEGGAGFTWGEIYGFYDYENFNKGDGEKHGASLKGTAHVYLGDTGASLYGQVYDTGSGGFAEHNRVVGFGYTDLVSDNGFFKPWIGVHHVSTTGTICNGNQVPDTGPDAIPGSTACSQPTENVSGWNGYMAGWTAAYNFNVAGQQFSTVNWNEIEFARNGRYAQSQGGKEGVNGGLSLFWHPVKNVKTGITYRYTYNKLGIKGWNDFAIYRVQYDF